MGTTIADIADWMQRLAPLELSENWDNTGLLLGDTAAPAVRVMTCLTLTSDVVDEALQQSAHLVITHHPLPFRPLNRLTTETTTGRLLWRLARAGIAVYSPHTAWDSAAGGVNDQLAKLLGLAGVEPLVPTLSNSHAGLGAGRIGSLSRPQSMSAVSQLLAAHLPACRPRGVDSGRLAVRVAIACGSGASLLTAALEHHCDLFLTGEATFHQCLEGREAGISLLLIGHYASERFAMEHLAQRLAADFSELTCWASQAETDPVRNLA
jgi:dinuclear metal center YbgI/SA1388 family protein